MNQTRLSNSSSIVATRATPEPFDTSYTRIRRELAQYAHRHSHRGILEFVTDIAIICVLFLIVLFAPMLWVKALASVALGFREAIVMVIAHDAAHGNTTPNKSLNKLIAVVGFLPSYFNYQLWLYDHNQTHHVRTNDAHPDLYRPFSKAEYDALPAWRQYLERLYRTPLGLCLYYPFERFLQYKLFPNDNFPKAIHGAAWCHFALISAYAAALFSFLVVIAPSIAHISSTQAVVLGMVIPFFVSTTTFTFTTYLQHTHPEIPWFKSDIDRRIVRQEDITPNVVMPRWYNFVSHNIQEHTCHHVNSKIPYYNAGHAQKRLVELMGGQAVTTEFTFRWFLKCMRVCKLYDFENHRWIDWDGTPLTGTLLKPHVLQRMREATSERERCYALAS